ncbi:MAG: hypothetical protein ACPGVY_04335 [Mycobacterium sp.]
MIGGSVVGAGTAMADDADAALGETGPQISSIDSDSGGDGDSHGGRSDGDSDGDASSNSRLVRVV